MERAGASRSKLESKLEQRSLRRARGASSSAAVTFADCVVSRCRPDTTARISPARLHFCAALAAVRKRPQSGDVLAGSRAPAHCPSKLPENRRLIFLTWRACVSRAKRSRSKSSRVRNSSVAGSVHRSPLQRFRDPRTRARHPFPAFETPEKLPPASGPIRRASETHGISILKTIPARAGFSSAINFSPRPLVVVSAGEERGP